MLEMEPTNVEQITQHLTDLLTRYGLKVLGAIAILIIGRIAAGIVAGGVRKALQRANVDPSLTGFLVALTRAAVVVFAVIAALSAFGIETASFVAVLGAAGFAIGFALQGSLGNFAAGVMILVFRPFKVGDFISAGGSTGSVKEVGIFTTTMHTPDNQKIIVPNGAIMSGTITNVNANDTRRVDLVAGIGYGDDMAKAKEVLENLLENHPKVLKEPAYTVQVTALADSSVNFIVRPWVNTPDYWPTYWELTRCIKEEFDKNGISIPFPQRDVHLYQTSN
jgi:small conductance mechanosensitive channel